MTSIQVFYLFRWMIPEWFTLISYKLHVRLRLKTVNESWLIHRCKCHLKNIRTTSLSCGCNMNESHQRSDKKDSSEIHLNYNHGNSWVSKGIQNHFKCIFTSRSHLKILNGFYLSFTRDLWEIKVNHPNSIQTYR